MEAYCERLHRGDTLSNLVRSTSSEHLQTVVLVTSGGTTVRVANAVKLPFILSRSLSCDLHHLVSLYLIEFRDVIEAVKDETAFKAGLDFFHVILETL